MKYQLADQFRSLIYGIAVDIESSIICCLLREKDVDDDDWVVFIYLDGESPRLFCRLYALAAAFAEISTSCLVSVYKDYQIDPKDEERDVIRVW